MIFEYALEPNLLASWNSFQRLVSLFGVTQGRLISRYPYKWSKLVYDAVPGGTTEKTKIEIALQRMANDLLLPRQESKWNDTFDWLTNAVAEHGRSPFRAILASQVHSNAVVIDATDLDATDLPPLLKAGPSRIVARDSHEIGKAVRPLLQISKRVLLVEPHFAIGSARFRDTLSAILTATLDPANKVRVGVEVELHLRMDKLEFADRAASLNARLQSLVPDKCHFTVIGWHKDELHNRYLITERSGIMLGEGFGLPDEKTSRPDDVLTMLDAATATALMKQFGVKAKHQLTHRISGTRPAGR